MFYISYVIYPHISYTVSHVINHTSFIITDHIHVTYYLSCIMCHISYVICHSHISYIIFHVSSVIYHLSCVIKYHLRHHAWYYHISHLTYHIISWFNKFHTYKHPINTTKTPLKTKMILENPPNFNRNYIHRLK